MREDNDTLSIDAEWNLGLNRIPRGINEHQYLSVEHELGDPSHRFSLEYLYDLREFKDSRAGNNGKTDTLRGGNCDAFLVGEEIELLEEEVETVLAEDEQFERLWLNLGCD